MLSNQHKLGRRYKPDHAASACWSSAGTDGCSDQKRPGNGRSLSATFRTLLQTLLVWATESLQYDSLLCDFVTRFQMWLENYETTVLKCYIQSVMSIKWRIPKHMVNFFVREIEHAVLSLRQENRKVVALLQQNLNDYLLCQSANFRRRVYKSVDSTLVSLQNEVLLFGVTPSQKSSQKDKQRHATLVRSMPPLHDWPVSRKPVMSFDRPLLMSQPKMTGSPIETRFTDDNASTSCVAGNGILAPLSSIVVDINDSITGPSLLPTLSGGFRATLWSKTAGTFALALQTAFSTSAEPVSFGISKKLLCIQKLTLIDGSKDNCRSFPDAHLALLTNPQTASLEKRRREGRGYRYRDRTRSKRFNVNRQGHPDTPNEDWQLAANDYMTLFSRFVKAYIDCCNKSRGPSTERQRLNDPPAERKNWAEPHLMDESLIESSSTTEEMDSYASWVVTSRTSRARLRAVGNLYPPTARALQGSRVVQRPFSWDSEQKIVEQLVQLVGAVWRQRHDDIHKLFTEVVSNIWSVEVQKMNFSPSEIALLTYPLTPVIVVAAMLPVHGMLSKSGAFLLPPDSDRDDDADIRPDVNEDGQASTNDNDDSNILNHLHPENPVASRGTTTWPSLEGPLTRQQPDSAELIDKDNLNGDSTQADSLRSASLNFNIGTNGDEGITTLDGGGASDRLDGSTDNLSFNSVPLTPGKLQSASESSSASSSSGSSSSSQSSSSSTSQSSPSASPVASLSRPSLPNRKPKKASSRLSERESESPEQRNSRQQALFMWSGMGLLALAVSQSSTTLGKFRSFLQRVVKSPSTVADYYTSQRRVCDVEWTRCYLRSVYNPLWWSTEARHAGRHSRTQSNDGLNSDDDDKDILISRMYRQQVAYIVSKFPESL